MIGKRKFILACIAFGCSFVQSLFIINLGVLTAVLVANAVIFGLYLDYNVKVKDMVLNKASK